MRHVSRSSISNQFSLQTKFQLSSHTLLPQDSYISHFSLLSSLVTVTWQFQAERRALKCVADFSICPVQCLQTLSNTPAWPPSEDYCKLLLISTYSVLKADGQRSLAEHFLVLQSVAEQTVSGHVCKLPHRLWKQTHLRVQFSLLSAL